MTMADAWEDTATAVNSVLWLRDEHLLDDTTSDGRFARRLSEALPAQRDDPAVRHYAWLVCRRQELLLAAAGHTQTIEDEPEPAGYRVEHVQRALGVQARHEATRPAVETAQDEWGERPPPSCVTIDGAGEWLVVSFPFSATKRDRVKLIPGRKWNAEKRAWLVPVAQWAQVADFAKTYHLTISQRAQTAMDAEQATGPAAPVYHLFLDKDQTHLVYKAGYVKEIVDHFRMVPGRKFNQKTNEWTFPSAQADKIDSIADVYGLVASPEAAPILRRWAIDAEEMREMSRAQDSDLVVPGVMMDLYGYQRAGVAYAQRAEFRTFLGDQPGLGKGHLPDTPILTPSGWGTVGDLAVGDRVIGSDGRPTTVTGVFPRGVQPTYRVRFADGAETITDGAHLWAVKDRNRQQTGRAALVLSTEQIFKGGKVFAPGAGASESRTYEQETHYLDAGGGSRWRIPLVSAPVEFESAEVLPIDAYTLGVWLGDGHWISGRERAQFTIGESDDEIIEHLHCTIGRIKRERGACYFEGNADFARQIDALGLAGSRSHTKFVPERYLRAGVAERLALLHGLMDTDGTPLSDGASGTEFVTTSDALKDAVVDLVGSLGGLCRVRLKPAPKYRYKDETRTGRPAWRVNVKLPAGMSPFRIASKAGRYVAPTKYAANRIIASIEPVGSGETICISVDADDHLYVIEHHIVTHNTVQAIASCELAGKFPVIIVCPSIMEIGWQREIQRATPHRTVTRLRGQKARSIQTGADYLIIGYPVVSFWVNELLAIEPQGLILDESHFVKSGKAQRTRAVKALAGVGTRELPKASIPTPVPDDGPRLLLSGTYVLNDTKEMIEQLKILNRLDDFGGAHAVTQRYVKLNGLDHGEQRKRRQEWHDRLTSICYVRRLKGDVLADLPAKQRTFQWVEGDPAIMSEYREAEEALLEYLARKAAELALEMGEDPHSAAVMARMRAAGAEHLVRIGVLRKLAAKAKIPAAIEWAKTFLDGGDDSLVVYAHHRDVVNGLADALGAERIMGGMNPNERQAVIDRFQAKTTRTVALSITAAGVGITLTAASNALFLEQAWNPGTLTQAEDRQHRIGQLETVSDCYMLTDQTIDIDMMELLEIKRKIVDDVTDGGDIDSWDHLLAAEENDAAVSAKGSIAGDLIERLTRRALGAEGVEAESTLAGI